MPELRDPAAEALAANHPDAALRIGRVVTGGPDGDVRFCVDVAQGTVTYALGDDAVDISLTDTFANTSAVLAGEQDANALFMRGQTKVAGNTALLLWLLAATKTEAYETIAAEIRASSGA